MNGGPWSGESPRRNSHTFNCRMMVKPLTDSEEESHENQEAHQKYETMQCFAVSQPKSIKEDGEGTFYLYEGWLSHLSFFLGTILLLIQLLNNKLTTDLTAFQESMYSFIFTPKCIYHRGG